MKNKIYQILFLLFIPFLSFSQEPAKLLTSTKFNNGEQIPEAKTASEWEQLSMNNQPVFMKKFVQGTEYYFYNWYAVTDNRGIINEKLMIPNQNEIVIWNAYSPIEIVPIGIVSEQGAFTKVTDQQYFWTTTEYNEKGKRESAVSVSISNSTIGETELKQAYKQEGFLVLVVETEKMKATTKSVAQTILNNNKISSPIASQPTKIEKENETNKMKPKVIDSNNKTVSIGSQIWMTENLNVDRFRNGDLIPEAKTVDEWEIAGKNKQPAWCYYDNDPMNGEKYGKLYNWYAVNDSRGLAPIGWNIPSNEDWNILSKSLGGDAKSGTKLKSNNKWYKNGNGTNEINFNAMPSGFRLRFGQFSSELYSTYFWVKNSNEARFLIYSEGFLYKYQFDYSSGCSVRCIKD
jgi:uncharacterized protein (TIGR02145 family)